MPQGTAKLVNIRAKISGDAKAATRAEDQPETVNAPLGEAYGAYWNWWLRGYARQIMLRFPECVGSSPDEAGPGAHPMKVIELFHRRRGCDAVFALARALGQPAGFDVVSHVLISSSTVPELVRRWSGLLSLQTSLRFAAANESSSFIEREQNTSLVLSPHKVRPANRKPFGPAMLAGVATGTLEGAGVEIRGIWSVPRGRAARPVYRFGTFLGGCMDFDSDIVIVLAEEAPRLRKMPSSPPLGFRHLLAPGAGPAEVRLVDRLVQVLERVEGQHSGLPAAASALGLSPRSLSRRLEQAGIGYGGLARFVRLRKASGLLVGGHTSLEEVAYLSAYSDRHHLAREFRKMSQITPAGLRDLLAG